MTSSKGFLDMGWVDVNMAWNEFSETDNCRPGVQIEVSYDNKLDKQKHKIKSKFLIGDINTLAGICDDCVAFEKDAIVIRYREVLSKYELS